MKRRILTSLFCLATFALQAEPPAKLELNKGDHVAIVGSGFADRQQHHDWLEFLIHKAYPDLELTVRNLGFAADEINVHPRLDDVPPDRILPQHEARRYHGETGAYRQGRCRFSCQSHPRLLGIQ